MGELACCCVVLLCFVGVWGGGGGGGGWGVRGREYMWVRAGEYVNMMMLARSVCVFQGCWDRFTDQINVDEVSGVRKVMRREITSKLQSESLLVEQI